MRPLYLLALTLTAGSLATISACTINGGTSAPPAVPPPAPMPDLNSTAGTPGTPLPPATPAPVVTAPPATPAPVVTAPPATTTTVPVVTAPPARPLPPSPPSNQLPPGSYAQVPGVGATNGACSTDADCRIFSDYCTGCDCRVLARSQKDPTCKSRGVQCLVDPCRDAKPTCAAGVCLAVKKSAQ